MSFLNSLMQDPVSFLMSAAAVVFVFGMVIFVHEFGHFIVAKKSGVKVDEFAFGFGPKIFSFQYGETLYAVNWIPLGGYNKFQGEVGEDYTGPVLEGEGSHQSSQKDRSRDFMAQSWHRRILIALAGPAMNYVLAFVLFALIFLSWGEPRVINSTVIGEVMAGMPAEQAGLKAGDEVLRVGDVAVSDFQTIAATIHGRPGLDTEILVKRGDEQLTLSVTPKDEGGRGLVGIRPTAPEYEYHPIGVFSSLQKSVQLCWFISVQSLAELSKSITQRKKPEVMGPVGITQFIAKSSQQGFGELVYLLALISVAIGLFNLFPVPLLDGGHVVYYLIEGIRGKPVSVNFMSKVNMVGLAMLLTLLVYVTFGDIQRLIK